ncbi:tetratricopeptide repeat protein [Malonomonas rubra]|uniref:tetratricopeptide repeat protein n=1 Tax=Malonomonas rubra TaxID=57040 RepID=UPI0026EF5813|nr:tetratricopeptide repeat protein [Malonomonas rubra]
MKKETILLVVVSLIVGGLIAVIFTNMQDKNPQVAGNGAPPAAPAVNYQQQISMLEGIVAKEPSNRNAWVQLGHNYFDSDQAMKAVEAYEKALELDRNDPNILTDQGVMYRRLGWFDKAIKNFEEANKLNPNHQQSLYNLGIVYRYDLQDISKTIETWEKFLAINPSGPGAAQVRADLEALKNQPTTQQPQ